MTLTSGADGAVHALLPDVGRELDQPLEVEVVAGLQLADVLQQPGVSDRYSRASDRYSVSLVPV